jgi:hypothetical protein
MAAFDLAFAKRAGDPPAVTPGIDALVGAGKRLLLGCRAYT